MSGRGLRLALLAVASFVMLVAPSSSSAGVTEIAAPEFGSSDPTYYGTQHRLAVSAGGRELSLHGLHATGVQLAWRNPGDRWRGETTGAVRDGTLISGTSTGDWPASIAVARDSGGVEHAWVVFARAFPGSSQPLYMRRISKLDSPDGPSVGPLIVVDSPPLGDAYKPDIQFESTPFGGTRGVVVWSRRASGTEHEVVAGWLTDLDTERPSVHSRTVLSSTVASDKYGTLVPTENGMRIVVRERGRLVLYTREAGAALESWARGPDGMWVSGFPSATALDSGEILTAIESSRSNHIVQVQRYSSAGETLPVELTLQGYATPTISSDGTNAWLIAVRQSDGFVISREFNPDVGWGAEDRVEVGSEGGGNYDYPNALRRVDEHLRFIVRGPSERGSTERSAVLAYERRLTGSDPDPELRLSGPRQQPLRKLLGVEAGCVGAPCRAAAYGRLRVGQRAGFALRGSGYSELQADRRVLRLEVGRRALSAGRRALRDGRRVFADVRVVAAGGGDGRFRATRRLRLVLR